MALVRLPTWGVEVTLIDNNGNTSTTGVSFPASRTFAEVGADTLDFIDLLSALTDAEIISYSIGTMFRENAPVAPPPSSEVERKLKIPLNTAVRFGASKLEIPSPLFTLETPNTDVVDASIPAVAAMINFLINGVLGAGNGPVTYYGADFVSAGTPEVKHRGRARRG